MVIGEILAELLSKLLPYIIGAAIVTGIMIFVFSKIQIDPVFMEGMSGSQILTDSGLSPNNLLEYIWNYIWTYITSWFS